MEISPAGDVLSDPWVYALVERRRKNGEIARRWEMIDLDPAAETQSSGNLRYRCDSLSLIRTKCVLIALGLPLFAAVYMIWHVVRAPLSALHMFFQTFENLITRPNFRDLFHLAVLPPLQALDSVWLSVRAPFYMIAMQSGALYGILKPLEGRKWVASIELAWKRGVSCKYDFRRMESDENVNQFFRRALSSKDFAHPFYLAECFQPYGTLNEPSILSVQFSLSGSHGQA